MLDSNFNVEFHKQVAARNRDDEVHKSKSLSLYVPSLYEQCSQWEGTDPKAKEKE